ncbi:protoporphyrinogen oxidase [Gordonia sp. (in: high G+C Gram-positive bacteria)]|uniref:protoporphyrinogen oxidase n=1 Tax=Gordonia sp. (in: high G+C Gram-positive bacteria) TaxID=84139 RepID=UPI003F9CFFB4
MTVRVAVIGGGVSGLTGAYDLRRLLGDDAHIDVFCADDSPGGILASATVDGLSLDVGAEAFIVRRPEARDLVAELGLGDEVVSPGGMRPAVWSEGRLHPLPSPALMGIPATASALGDLVDDAERHIVETESDREMHWTRGADVSVGELVADRFGEAVVARSVDPMLGGVYSARAHDLGLREAIPALAAVLDAGAPSLTAAVADVLSRPTGDGPVFGALRGGYRTLVDALVTAARADVHTGVSVRSVQTDGSAYDVEVGSAADRVDASGYDAVLVAVPVWTAGALLDEVAPPAADAFSAVDAAGSAVIAFAVDGPTPEQSGVLVASDAGDLSIKAITLSSRKWPHLAATDGRSVLRASIGRLGHPVTASDEELIARATADLGIVFCAAGLSAPRVRDAAVQRWPAGLPHYGPGHLSAMSAAIATLPAGLAVAGSGYRGVGVPACIGTARDGASRLAGHVNALT